MSPNSALTLGCAMLAAVLVGVGLEALGAPYFVSLPLCFVTGTAVQRIFQAGVRRGWWRE